MNQSHERLGINQDFSVFNTIIYNIFSFFDRFYFLSFFARVQSIEELTIYYLFIKGLRPA
jgi:hypothetical protein